MRVAVNGSPVEAPAEGGATLGALLSDLRRRGDIAPDQVVVALALDGRPCVPGDLDRPEDTRLEAVGEVAVSTDDLRGYSRRILGDARGMAAVLREASARLAGEFRAGAPDKANGDLFNLLSALQALLVCIYHVDHICGMSGGPLDSHRRLFSEVAGALNLIQFSQERKDWTSVADGLERDLVPALAGFGPLLGDMLDAI